MSIFGGLLLLDLIHDGIDGKAEAGHARQVTDGEVKLQRAVFPRVVRAPAALAAHCWLTQQLRAVEEPRPHLDLGGWGEVGMQRGTNGVIFLFNLLQCFKPESFNKK